MLILGLLTVIAIGFDSNWNYTVNETINVQIKERSVEFKKVDDPTPDSDSVDIDSK